MVILSSKCLLLAITACDDFVVLLGYNLTQKYYKETD